MKPDWNSFGRDVPVHDPDNSNTPTGLAIRWLNHLEVDRGRLETTVSRYHLTLKQWLDWASTNGVAPMTPTLEELEEFIRRPRLRQGKGRLGAPATRRAEVTHLSGWFKWLHARNLVPADPTVELNAPTVRASNPKPVPDDHWLVLWESNLSPRVRLSLGLGYYIGLRRSEIVSLQGKQLTDDLVVDFVRKGGGEDTLPWTQMVEVYQEELPRLASGADVWHKDLLEHADQNRNHLLFWSDGQQMYKEMVRACRRIDLPEYTPHQLRHSCATNLIRAGMPIPLVSNLLNHSSIDITMRYVQAGGAQLAEWRKRRKSNP